MKKEEEADKNNSKKHFEDSGIALKEIPLTPGSEAVSTIAHDSVDRRSDAICVHLITACSEKLPDWLIREPEESFENNIRGP